MEALFYTKLNDNKVQCTLCPHECILKDGQTGICRIRKNIAGQLQAETYELFSSISFDPIEKKPLYHFFPGKEILSVGSFGCNMRCQWCQNCEISQTGVNSLKSSKHYSQDELINLAQNNPNNIGVAFTYNEPSIAFETNIMVAKLFREKGLKNVMVSNGYMNKPVLTEYLKYIDAFNLDIKGFNSNTHKKYTSARLEFILNNAKTVHKSGIHLELTYLVVPGANDNIEEFEGFVMWIKNELSPNVPLHISRYFPRNKYTRTATTPELLNLFASAASEELNYVYLGNLNSSEYQNTHCPLCLSEVIMRNGYTIYITEKSNKGMCENCNIKIFESL